MSVLRLYDYSCWANQKLLGAVSQLTPEEFTRTVGGSYGSVRNTLVHILSAEWGWLDRCGGLPRGERLKAEDYPTLESVLIVWRKVEAEMRAFLETVSDAELRNEISFAFGGPPMTLSRGDILQHAVIHAVHHRGQIALMLRELGHAPGNFDFLFYAAERPSLHRATP